MKLKALRTDQGHKYLFDQFRQICDEKKIERQLTIQELHNKMVLRKKRNMTLFEMFRFIMAQANLPISYWGDMLLTVAYILN